LVPSCRVLQLSGRAAQPGAPLPPHLCVIEPACCGPTYHAPHHAPHHLPTVSPRDILGTDHPRLARICRFDAYLPPSRLLPRYHTTTPPRFTQTYSTGVNSPGMPHLPLIDPRSAVVYRTKFHRLLRPHVPSPHHSRQPPPLRRPRQPRPHLPSPLSNTPSTAPAYHYLPREHAHAFAGVACRDIAGVCHSLAQQHSADAWYAQPLPGWTWFFTTRTAIYGSTRHSCRLDWTWDDHDSALAPDMTGLLCGLGARTRHLPTLAAYNRDIAGRFRQRPARWPAMGGHTRVGATSPTQAFACLTLPADSFLSTGVGYTTRYYYSPLRRRLKAHATPRPILRGVL